MAVSADESWQKVSPKRDERPNPLLRWLAAGILVALLDISFAIFWWVGLRGASTPARILQSIASGVLGRAALEGGSRAAAMGAALHCLVAFIWTSIFLLAIHLIPVFRSILSSRLGVIKVGVPFGMMVWLAMDFVVIPLSRARPTPFGTQWFWVSLAWHAIGVGLPLAVVLRDVAVARVRASPGR